MSSFAIDPNGAEVESTATIFLCEIRNGRELLYKPVADSQSFSKYSNWSGGGAVELLSQHIGQIQTHLLDYEVGIPF